jgi:hypothetical protein
MIAKSFIHLATLSLLGCCFSPSADAGVVTFASDPSWNASVMNPDQSVGASLGAAQCYSTLLGFDTSHTPGACAIWQPGWTPETLGDNAGTFFRKTIYVPGTPVSGSIWIAVDDWAWVRVNGVVICTRGSITNVNTAVDAQNTIQAFDLMPALVPGLNTFIIWARNGPGSFAGNCAPCPWYMNRSWVYFGGSITHDNTTPAGRSSWGALKTIYR